MNLENKIIEFVSNETRISKKVKINLNTRLLEDIRIDGDDAIEFFEKYSKAFNVNIDDIILKKHFGDEGFNPFTIFFSLFCKKLSSITVKSLIDSAKEKKWIYDYPK